MAEIREPRRRAPTHTAPAAKQPRSFYLITGLAVGGLWLLNRDKSLLYHAVQMTAVMSSLTALQIVLQIVLRRRAGAPASPSAYARLLGLLLGAKLVLVAVGVGAEWLLAPHDTPIQRHCRRHSGPPGHGTRTRSGQPRHQQSHPCHRA